MSLTIKITSGVLSFRNPDAVLAIFIYEGLAICDEIVNLSR